MMKLLSATPSPYARKVRIALAEKGLRFELVTDAPWNAETTTPRYNPIEKVPVLILEDGTTVYESRHILEYLEVKYPDPSLRLPEIDWSDKYANLVELRERLSQRPSFKDTVPRVQQIDTAVVWRFRLSDCGASMRRTHDAGFVQRWDGELR